MIRELTDGRRLRLLRNELRVGRALRHVLRRVRLRRLDRRRGCRQPLLPFSEEVLDALSEYLIVGFVLTQRLEIFYDSGVLRGGRRANIKDG